MKEKEKETVLVLNTVCGFPSPMSSAPEAISPEVYLSNYGSWSVNG